ncbi:MAG: hypothetical protein ACK4QW_16715 [Alphaproteobacteria bacterium]
MTTTAPKPSHGSTSPDRQPGASGHEVRAGYRFPTDTIVVDEAEQRRMHGYCDIPAERWGDRIDPTFLARYPIRVIGNALFSCHPDRGYVHMMHRIRQLAPVTLGEAITVDGWFVAVDPVPRGWMMKGMFEYRRTGGELVMVVEPEALMADPTRMPPPGAAKAGPGNNGGAKAPGTGPADGSAAGFAAIHTKTFTPEKVVAYSGKGRNPIHDDPEHAQAMGFRAPIVAGNQLINQLLEPLAMGGRPERFDVDVRLRRPVFWDEAVTVEGRRDASGALAATRLVKSDGRVASDCTILDLTR